MLGLRVAARWNHSTGPRWRTAFSKRGKSGSASWLASESVDSVLDLSDLSVKTASFLYRFDPRSQVRESPPQETDHMLCMLLKQL